MANKKRRKKHYKIPNQGSFITSFWADRAETQRHAFQLQKEEERERQRIGK